MGFSEFYDRAKKVSLEELTYSTEFIKDIVVESRHLLAAQLDYEKKTGDKALTDPKLSQAEILNFPYPAEWDK